MRIGYAYEQAVGFKKKLKELDKLITTYEDLAVDFPIYKNNIASLQQERAELISQIGKKNA